MPVGTDGPDTIVGLSGFFETIDGGAGDDRLTALQTNASGGGIVTLLLGGAGNDTLTGARNSEDTLDGGAGNDVLVGQAQRPHDYAAFSTATSGVRVNLGLAGPQDVGGGQGIDTFIDVWGALGTPWGDTITGGAGIGIFYGDAGGDLITGGPDLDALYGERGDDTLQGGDGNDDLFGGTGSDSMAGGSGNDVFQMGSPLGRGSFEDRLNDGNDTLDGGPGSDTISFWPYGPADIVIDLRLTTLQPITDMGAKAFRSVENIQSNDGADTLTGDDADNMFLSFAGNDVLAMGGGADTVYAGQGADTIEGGDGPNYLRGEDGNDSITGGQGFDDINGNTGNDTCVSGGGDDWVVGGKDNDSLVGAAGQNLVYGNIGADTCDGGGGNDIVRGGQDNDVLFGGAGDDYVSGDKGDDTVSGDAGADIFHTFGDAGIDRVLDFNLTQGDRVQLDPDTTYTVAQSGADTVISMTGGGQMILVGVQVSSLTPGWVFGA